MTGTASGIVLHHYARMGLSVARRHLLAETAGGHPLGLAEDVREITLIAESARQGDVGQGPVGGPQQLAGGLDAEVAQQFAERAAGAFLEEVGKVARRSPSGSSIALRCGRKRGPWPGALDAWRRPGFGLP